MESAKKAGFPFLGAMFLALAAYKFFAGDGWVVWLILGVLFGGLGTFRALKREDA